LATFAEFEVDLLRMRTREGMAAARAKGKLKGRQPKLSKKQQPNCVACTTPVSTASPTSPTSSRSRDRRCIAHFSARLQADLRQFGPRRQPTKAGSRASSPTNELKGYRLHAAFGLDPDHDTCRVGRVLDDHREQLVEAVEALWESLYGWT